MIASANVDVTPGSGVGTLAGARKQRVGARGMSRTSGKTRAAALGVAVLVLAAGGASSLVSSAGGANSERHPLVLSPDPGEAVPARGVLIKVSADKHVDVFRAQLSGHEIGEEFSEPSD